MAALATTPVDEIPKIHAALRAGFKSGKSKSIAFRKQQLSQVAYLLKDNLERFKDALNADLGRHPAESESVEMLPSITEAVKAFHSVKKWAAPEKPAFDPTYFAMSPAIRKEPKGVVLIIAPFNYPIMNLFSPVVGAIAAGNAVVLKPSDLTPNVSNLVAELVPKYLDQDLYRVVSGGVPETSKILELPFDHILYTGSSRVAKIVAAAAAKHLCPVSLELGGKSPVVIDPNCDLKTAAKRLLWGKLTNSGQTCVAPDYVLVPRYFQDTLVDALKETIKTFYGENPKENDSFGRMINVLHTQRVKKLIDETKGTVVLGGEVDVDAKYIAPTIVKDVKGDDSLMSEELFGPVLPILPVENVDEAIDFINSRDHPLALYVYSRDSAFKSKVFDNTQSGAAVANDCNLHIAVTGLPFGGIGPSGTGHYMGKFGFDMFSHERSTIDNPSWVDAIVLRLRYPPYTSRSSALMKATLPSLPPRHAAPTKRWGVWLTLALAGAVSAMLIRSGRLPIAQLRQ